MRYYTYLEEPTLDSYRLDYSPRDGLGTVLICPWIVVTGQSGRTYNAMRALPLPDKQMSMNFGTYVDTAEIDGAGDLLHSFRDFPAIEAFAVTYDDDAVVYQGSTFRLAEAVDHFRWSDAGGRVDLRAERLGQACTFWVPQQEDFEHPVLSRSHLGRATGTIDGDPVVGIFMVDHIYSRPDLTFRETNFTTHLHNYWMNWLVEYEDGTTEGGFAWRGQPGTGFSSAHHYVDGKSIARSDARMDIERNDAGTMSQVTLSLGQDVSIVFEQNSSTDWPIHTLGTVSSISRDKKVVNSWSLLENFPINWGRVEEYQAAHAALYGRYPSLKSIFDKVDVSGGVLSVPRPRS